MHRDDQPDPVESFTTRLGQLELSIRVRRVGPDPTPVPPIEIVEPGQAWTAVSGSVSEPWAPELLPRDFPPPLEEQALSATTARAFAAFAALSLRHLGAAGHRLSVASGGDWTPAARLGRASKAGLIARRLLEGAAGAEESPGIPFRNQYYLVLRGLREGGACWTTSFSVYSSRVFKERGAGRAFGANTVSHSFPRLSECQAYLSGARASWPPEVQQ